VTRHPKALDEISSLLRQFDINHPSCVYFLCYEDEVVYVGQSTDLNIRSADHLSGAKIFDSIHYIPVALSELNRVEREFITLFNPKYNDDGVTRRMRNGDAVSSLVMAKDIANSAKTLDAKPICRTAKRSGMHKQ